MFNNGFSQGQKSLLSTSVDLINVIILLLCLHWDSFLVLERMHFYQMLQPRRRNENDTHRLQGKQTLSELLYSFGRKAPIIGLFSH